MPKISGAKALIELLKHERVEIIFGYPGGTILPIFDAIAQCPDLKFILPRHEQGGIHAAEGYARASGKTGVVIATSGPGATNLVTGIADAFMDSTPLVIFTGQVATGLLGNDAFQEVDFTGITRSICKHNYLARDPENLPRIVREAFFIAATGRPGPVVIDLPIDICTAEIDAKDAQSSALNLRGYKPTLTGNARQIAKAAAAINRANRPLWLLGRGAAMGDAPQVLREIATKIKIPAVATLMGLGILPATLPENLGMLGMHGSQAANFAVSECDLLIAVGARFDDRVTGKISGFAPRAQIIHLDIDPTSVGKNVPAAIPIVGDANRILPELAPQITAKNRDEWLAQIYAWKEKFSFAYADSSDEIFPQFVIEELAKQIAKQKRQTLIATDVGQHQMWTAQFYQFNEPRSLITSGGLGAMGFGLPAAIGAQLAAPEKNVVLITGDGGLQMNIQELATLKRLRLPLKILLMNNQTLGMVKQLQTQFYDRRYAFTDLGDNPDFVALAQAYGIAASKCEQRKLVTKSLNDWLASPNASLLDMRISPDQKVLPIVPSGRSLAEMII